MTEKLLNLRLDCWLWLCLSFSTFVENFVRQMQVKFWQKEDVYEQNNNKADENQYVISNNLWETIDFSRGDKYTLDIQVK